MGYLTTDGTTESAPESHGRTPGWHWAVLAVVWVGIAAACLDLQLRINDLERDIARLEERRRAEAKALDEAATRYQAWKTGP